MRRRDTILAVAAGVVLGNIIYLLLSWAFTLVAWTLPLQMREAEAEERYRAAVEQTKERCRRLTVEQRVQSEECISAYADDEPGRGY